MTSPNEVREQLYAANQAQKIYCWPDRKGESFSAVVTDIDWSCTHAHDEDDGMGKTRQIRCICKNDFYNPCDRITHVGGVEPDGKPWKLTQRDAIKGIETGKWRFHVTVEGKRDWVIVAFNPFGSLYLKTENDEIEPNKLLNLPECA